ncbi:MAG: L-seryl-tRNA(Sec) selenium transferase [Pseudomonadales bacterium]
MHDERRKLPSVDQILQQAQELVEQWGHQQVKEQIRSELSKYRQQLTLDSNTNNSDAESPPLDVSSLLQSISQQLEYGAQSSLKPVFNLTGTILHTNLGRAVLPRQAIDAMVIAASSPANLEFDLSTGKRGERDSHIEAILCELCGAEAVTVVNNNAAAVLLVLNSLALNREVPVSRGELVEIGGSFRIPEVMQRAPCHLVEVGATNRTHLKDYKAAINENTALLMKVHTSNFSIQGFTKSVSEAELAALAKEHDLPCVIDLGSGNLIDMAQFGLPAEPTAAQSLQNGADIITFSGDKLLGGPQCGIIAGRKDLIDKIRSNPLKRALRVDKLTIAALSEVLKLYRHPEKLKRELPTIRYLNRSTDDIHSQAQRILPLLIAALPEEYQCSIEACDSQVGSGALPISTLPSFAITTRANTDAALSKLQTLARRLPKPIIGRLNDKCFSLDVRCLDDESEFLSQLNNLSDLLTT